MVLIQIGLSIYYIGMPKLIHRALIHLHYTLIKDYKYFSYISTLLQMTWLYYH